MKKILTLALWMILFTGFASVASAYNPGGCQCTDYVKDNIPQIRPYDLTSIAQKRATINMYFPTVGSAAIHDLGTRYGHISVVRNVIVQPDGSVKVTIQGKNLDNKCDSTGTTTITTRTESESNLKIVGYFNPNYTVGSSKPLLNSISVTSGRSGVEFWTTASGDGFEVNSSQAVILGGEYCNSSFGRCVIPNNVITNKSSTQLKIPLTLGGGTYHIYIYNPSNGKTSQGKRITIN